MPSQDERCALRAECVTSPPCDPLRCRGQNRLRIAGTEPRVGTYTGNASTVSERCRRSPLLGTMTTSADPPPAAHKTREALFTRRFWLACAMHFTGGMALSLYILFPLF